MLMTEVEHTGLHSQFYDKFNIRYHLSQVMMSVWNNTTHRKKLLQESKYSLSNFKLIKKQCPQIRTIRQSPLERCYIPPRRRIIKTNRH